MRRIVMPVVFLCAAVAASFGAGTANADGLPVLGVDVGDSGVVSPEGGPRYVTLRAGGNTVVARVHQAGGRVETSTLVRGTFTIPAVAYDASAAGLSGDGRTLVLIEPRVSFPRAQTRLLVLRAPSLRVLEGVTLHGDFSFDAVSPGGSQIYLVEYVSPADPTRYRVRAYNLAAGRLLAAPVTDPKERGESMRGSPITRATSPDGRWAYTLYDGGGVGGTPFVHALDTVSRTAHCIDLPSLRGADVWPFRFRADWGAHSLTLIGRKSRPLLAIDTQRFVARASEARPTVSAPTTGFPWLPVLLSVVGGLLAATAVAVVLRRRGAITRPARTPARAS